MYKEAPMTELLNLNLMPQRVDPLTRETQPFAVMLYLWKDQKSACRVRLR